MGGGGRGGTGGDRDEQRGMYAVIFRIYCEYCEPESILVEPKSIPLLLQYTGSAQCWNLSSILALIHYTGSSQCWFCSSILAVPNTGTAAVYWQYTVLIQYTGNTQYFSIVLVPSTSPVYWQYPVHCYDPWEGIVSGDGVWGRLRREVVASQLFKGLVAALPLSESSRFFFYHPVKVVEYPRDLT